MVLKISATGGHLNYSFPQNCLLAKFVCIQVHSWLYGKPSSRRYVVQEIVNIIFSVTFGMHPIENVSCLFKGVSEYIQVL